LLTLTVFQDSVLKSVETKVGFDVWDKVTYKDNLIKLEVYFEEFNFEKITETPSYVVSIIRHNYICCAYTLSTNGPQLLK